MAEREFEELVSALRDAIRPALARSESVRRLVRALGALLVAEADDVGPGAGGETDPEQRPGDSPAQTATAASSPDRPVIAGPRRVVPEPVNEVPLRLGDAGARVRVFGRPEEIARARAAAAPEPERETPAGSERPIDLALIARRCRLKAEACRVFIDRRAAAGDNGREAALIEEINGLLERAKQLPDCFLWMVFPGREQPEDGPLDLIARWYDALAEGAGLISSIDASPGVRRAELEEAMQMLAHADAGLRVALEPSWLTKPDVDQDEVHLWMRWETKVRRILVHRHMRLEDPPEVDSVDELRERIAALRDRVEEQVRRAVSAERHLKRIQYHADQIVAGRTIDPTHDWRVIETSLAELGDLGLPHSSERIAAALESLVESSAEADPALSRSSAALAISRAALWAADEDPATVSRVWSERVEEVRALLAGRRVVVIGGEPRPEAIERFRDAFALEAVDWVRLAEHGSGAAMRPPIVRPDTALVLVLVKLAGHLHVDEAKAYAREAGKPVVLLQAGYNPEQVAFAILGQASEQLRSVV